MKKLILFILLAASSLSLVFMTINDTNGFSNNFKSEALSQVLNSKESELKKYDVRYLTLSICVSINFGEKCFNEIDSNLEVTQLSRFDTPEFVFDGLHAELENGRWVVYASEELKNFNKNIIIKNFNAIIKSYIDELKRKKMLSNQWK